MESTQPHIVMYFVEMLDFSGVNTAVQTFVFENKVAKFALIAMYMVSAFVLGMQAIFSFHTWSSMSMVKGDAKSADPPSAKTAQANVEPFDPTFRYSTCVDDVSPMEQEIIGVLYNANANMRRRVSMTREDLYDILSSKAAYPRRKVYAALPSLVRRKKIYSSFNENNLSDRKIRWFY